MKSVASTQPSAVRRRAPREIRHRLFCFPYAGGGGATYWPWARHVPGWVEIFPIDPRGLEGRVRDGHTPDFFEYVVTSAEAVEPRMDLSFSCFGHSLGALVAFELARYLKREFGREPQHLFVSGCRGPRVPDRYGFVQGLPDAELMEEVSRRYGGIPDDVLAEPDLWGIMLPNLRADLAAAETYRFVSGTMLTCAVTALGGDEDTSVTEEELLTWRRETGGPFTHRTFPGGHFFVHTAKDEVARLVGGTLGSFETMDLRESETRREA